MENKNLGNKITKYLGEFADKKLEKQFFSSQIPNIFNYLEHIFLFMGILFLLFIIPDFIFINDNFKLILIIINRVIFFIISIVLYFVIKSVKDNSHYPYWITLGEILTSIELLLIIRMYENSDFLIQAFGIVIIILFIFLIPNRWILMLTSSFVLSMVFFILTINYVSPVNVGKYVTSLIFIFLAIALCSISSYKINYYKRSQFLINMELTKLSVTDALTGIYNRFKFNEELNKWIKYCSTYGRNLSLVLFDLDNFKDVNDKYGHLAGDRILVEITEIVKKNIRDTDIFARWGGEEFFILFPNTNKNKTHEIVKRIREKIITHVFDGIEKVTCSFGIVSLNANESMYEILERADKTLYMAKEAGKDTIIC